MSENGRKITNASVNIGIGAGLTLLIWFGSIGFEFGSNKQGIEKDIEYLQVEMEKKVNKETFQTTVASFKQVLINEQIEVNRRLDNIEKKIDKLMTNDN
jgi:hypothetical protein